MSIRSGLYVPPFPAFSGKITPLRSTAVDRWALARIRGAVRSAPLRFALWDGFEWRQIGGTVDPATNTMLVRVSGLNWVALIQAAPRTPASRIPGEKVISPNGDGHNDTAHFYFEDRTDDVKVDIYDATGREIRTFYTASTMDWDGRDDGGKIVESGVYIYQFSVDGQRVSGVIAVAK